MRWFQSAHATHTFYIYVYSNLQIPSPCVNSTKYINFQAHPDIIESYVLQSNVLRFSVRNLARVETRVG